MAPLAMSSAKKLRKNVFCIVGMSPESRTNMFISAKKNAEAMRNITAL